MLSFLPLVVLDEIWDLIESVSEGFLPTLEIIDTTECNASASYSNCYLCTDKGKVVTRLYDKRDDFNFLIVNFPF